MQSIVSEFGKVVFIFFRNCILHFRQAVFFSPFISFSSFMASIFTYSFYLILLYCSTYKSKWLLCLPNESRLECDRNRKRSMMKALNPPCFLVGPCFQLWIDTVQCWRHTRLWCLYSCWCIFSTFHYYFMSLQFVVNSSPDLSQKQISMSVVFFPIFYSTRLDVLPLSIPSELAS